MSRQLSLALPKWGGRRTGAGRPRIRPHPGLVGPGVPHVKRDPFPARHPVHVTIRVRPGVGYLRAWRRARAIEAALREARSRFGVRLIHYAILGNHLHLIVEAEGPGALSRGMQGLCVRLARRLNRLAARRGPVFADRYHAHVLRSRREAARAVAYVRDNYRHHTREHLLKTWTDPLSSSRYLVAKPGNDDPVVEPRTWLLRVGWRQEPPP